MVDKYQQRPLTTEDTEDTEKKKYGSKLGNKDIDFRLLFRNNY